MNEYISKSFLPCISNPGNECFAVQEVKGDRNEQGLEGKISFLKRWDRYIHDTNQYYTTIDYKQQLKYVSDIIEWETKWLDDAIASDTLEGVVE